MMKQPRWRFILFAQKIICNAVVVLLLFSSAGKAAGTIEDVFLTEEAALHKVFSPAQEIRKKEWHLSREQQQRIEKKLAWRLESSTLTVYEGWQNNQRQGFAIITEEIGKVKPITFIVKLNATGAVQQVEVMVYRESVGNEVKRSRFTHQFKGKKPRDPVRLNRDILNISGATMSSQALAIGVKKVLLIIEEIYFRPS